MGEPTATAEIEELYEFSAPCFFDFMRGESEEETRNAELWFETALSYAPSPFMARIKAASRSFHVEGLCNFSEEDQMQKASESSGATASNSSSEYKPQAKLMPNKVKEEIKPSEAKVEINPIVSEIANDDKDKENAVTVCSQENGSAVTEKSHLIVPGDEVKNKSTVQVQTDDKDKENAVTVCSQENGSAVTEKSHLIVPGDEVKNKSTVQVQTEACTPKPLMNSQKKLVSDKKHQTAKKIPSTIRNPSVLKPKTGSAGTPNLALVNQAIKRQKLDGGRSRQILNVKPHNLLHKSKLGLTSGSSNLSFSAAKTFNKLERKVYVLEQAAPFVSMAEMMNKFQSCTRDLSLPHSSLSNWPALKLTRPKEPEFETAQRMRPVRVKSAAELEEEMMAKIPKFKARPLNKKIFEASPLPSLPRSTPKPPEFQEFHLETMARASKNAERSPVASTEVSCLNNQWKPYLTEPKSPVLQTSLRAKPPKVKSSIELEQEELEKAPKFKARPLNKKIFESKGELGIFCNAKKQVTIPQEFHFATHERIPLPVAVFDLFDKLSLNSESSHDLIPRNTIPNPFHLHTEERGAEKEKKFMMEIIEKQFEEERARVPKANPYPYTTDYPVIPPKPEPKQCTKPEPFQLESLVRHEEEMKREMEERKKKEKEEAQMRVFKAQPVLKEDPIPVPEKVRQPLTQVQEFDLHVNHRAVDRAEFDQKIKEKEMIYKRYREESEAARLIEEEKALKQLRRTMIPHARPVPKFDHPFCPQKSSKETTNPKSPYLRVLQRIERKKTIGSLNTPTSSPATLMR
ncbi:targeting protein for XKLP2 [Hibiscus trionum]|uniref:Targeting protein for XKLP2 n=1 Tax=Hibiscus trionum TaxID=183268 RepID=A0A9W7MRC3_HIBTR|nr:targeting protein for XKLP2 [Hibiscus trionum]